jgi:ribosomal protein L11 methyltransferase
VLELTLRVGAADVEEVLDAVLPALPGGVHVREDGDAVELAILAGPESPGEEELRCLAGGRLRGLRSVKVSDDWRERRLGRYEPLVVADRFLVRPDWAPPAAEPGLTEIVLAQSPAFGTAMHPTTQACLASLAEVEPSGSLLDCGCGSGVLAVAAAKLGFSPVIAVDVDETSVAATRANATGNGVALDVRRLDLFAGPPPAAETIVANVPPPVQEALAAGLEGVPSLAILSGFHPDEIEAVASAWSARGMAVEDEVRANEWSVLVLR